MMGNTSPVSRAPWPGWNEELTRDETVTVVVQVNGKVRSRLEVAAGTSREELLQLATSDTRIQQYIAEGEITKSIVVPDKLVNLVIR